MDKRPLIILGLTAIFILSLFIIFGKNNESYNWRETYKETSKAPYGAFLIHELLQSYFPEAAFTSVNRNIAKKLPATTDEKANYIFIGEALLLDSASIDRIQNFVANGNNAFIAAKATPNLLMEDVYFNLCNNEIWERYNSIKDSTITLDFIHPNLKNESVHQTDFIIDFEPTLYDWHFMDSIYFCEQENPFIPLGTIDNRHFNFVKKQYGEGHFYFHTNPIVFSNLLMKSNQHFEYANKIFSHLDAGDIYFDIGSRISRDIVDDLNDRARNRNTKRAFEDSPFSYILSQASLSWAWYTSLLLGLLYVSFRAKRKQRIIPVLETNDNTSMDFVSTIGRLYFLQNDHKMLSEQKMKLFLTYIRDRYNISTKDLENKRLAEISQVPESIVSNIMNKYDKIKNKTEVSETDMVDFHIEMDKFYKTCK